MTVDQHVEVARIQREIASLLGISSEDAIFKYTDHKKGTRLDLVTINPRHDQSFLFHTTDGKDQLHALEQMLQYASTHRQTEQSYTIQWMEKGSHELQTSYFRGVDIHEILDKFYFERNKDAYRIFSITLNPSS